MSTVIIGAVFVDVKGFARDRYSPTGTNIGSIDFVHGGVCRNVCENFACQGAPVTFISMVEDSAIGRDVAARLNALGADTEHLLTRPNGMGMWLAILNEHGDLVGSISRQPDFSPMEAYLRENGKAILEKCDQVVLEFGLNDGITEFALELCEKLDKPVYAVMGNMDVILRKPEHLKKLKCFICNEIEAGLIFGRNLSKTKPDEMLRILKAEAAAAGIQSMVITMGSQGAVWMDGETGESGHCPAFDAVMVDSTGAGDAFFSGTIMALNQKYPLSSAVLVGSKLAAATIACQGSNCGKIDHLFSIE